MKKSGARGPSTSGHYVLKNGETSRRILPSGSESEHVDTGAHEPACRRRRSDGDNQAHRRPAGRHHRGVASKVAQKTNTAGKPYVELYINATRYPTPDENLFPTLLASEGKAIAFRSEAVTYGDKTFNSILEVVAAATTEPAADVNMSGIELSGPWDRYPD